MGGEGLMAEEKWQDWGSTFLSDDGEEFIIELKQPYTEEEMQFLRRLEARRQFYYDFLIGAEPSKFDRTFPPIKPWSPYTDIHDKIMGWLND